MSEEAEEGDDAEGSPLPQGEAIGAAGAISAINDINAVGTIDAVNTADAAGAVDVVVLAGGTGRRLGGASKPDVVARGARLLDHVLTGLAALSGPSRSSCPAGSAGRVGRSGPSGAGAPRPGRVVVVAPERVALPPGVLRALEDPPLGGPVAGIAAGVVATRDAHQTPRQAGQRRLGQPMGADLRLKALHPGREEGRGALRREIARHDPGPSGGQHHPGTGGDGLPDGPAHRLGPVGHDAHRLDDDVVLGQEPGGQWSRDVLALSGGAAIGDGDDRARDGLRQGPEGLLDDGGGSGPGLGLGLGRRGGSGLELAHGATVTAHDRAPARDNGRIPI